MAGSPDGRTLSGMNSFPRTDSQLRHAIVKNLDWSPDVRSEHIAVAVTDGTVTLAGEAADVAEKDAALRAARQVAGVVAVVDEIEVRADHLGLNEADIARMVTDALQADQLLQSQGVSATVHNRIVTLVGVVAEIDQRTIAEQAVRAVPGVRAVVNDLRVLPHPGGDATKQRVAEALTRAVDSEIEGLDVAIEGHTAILEGAVHSWYERRAAERAALAVPGVTAVDNRLVVTY